MTASENARLTMLLEQFPPSDPDSLDEEQPFVLIERSNYDRSYYLTGHPSARDAASYHDSQEYPHDWSIVKLVDVRDGKEYEAIPSTTFEESA